MARYDLAVPGSFKLLPSSDEHLNELARDYDRMQAMLFGNRPPFASIFQALRKLQAQINVRP